MPLGNLRTSVCYSLSASKQEWQPGTPEQIGGLRTLALTAQVPRTTAPQSTGPHNRPQHSPATQYKARALHHTKASAPSPSPATSPAHMLASYQPLQALVLLLLLLCTQSACHAQQQQQQQQQNFSPHELFLRKVRAAHNAANLIHRAPNHTHSTPTDCQAYTDKWAGIVASNLARFVTLGINRELLEAAVDYATKRDGGWRMLVWHGRLYAQPLGLTLARHGAAQQRGKLHEEMIFMLKSHCMGMLPEGVEFVYRHGDHGIVAPRDLIPIFSWSRDTPEQNDILLPYGISCLHLQRFNTAFEQVPWEKKHKMAFWRGATTGGEFTEANWRQFPRTQLVQACQAHPELCSARFTQFVQITPAAKRQMKAELGMGVDPGGAVPFPQFSRYRYNLLIDGNSAPSSRFAPLLFSGTALLKQDSSSYEFFYPLLEPGKHYLPLARNLSDLGAQIRWAMDHDEEMRQMALQARLFAETMLNDGSVGCYVQQLLSSYQRLMKYTPEPDKELLSWELVPNPTIRNRLEGYLDRKCGVQSVVQGPVKVEQIAAESGLVKQVSFNVTKVDDAAPLSHH